MPPVNDNFANAVVLSNAISGSYAGDNIGATMEPAEPGNGKTVWFNWTPAANYGLVFFSTARTSPDTNPARRPQLKTVLRIFTGTGPAAAQLTEVTYTVNGTQRYAKWDLGSYVVFTPTAGTTYRIRIDGVGGHEGYFDMSWGKWPFTTMGACDECPPDYTFGAGCPVATVEIDVTDVLSSNPCSFSFGTFAAGTYSVRYCRGSWGDTIVSPPWTVNDRSNAVHGKSFDVILAGSTIVDFGGNPTGNFFQTQLDASHAYKCLKATFDHPGGDISVRFMDDAPLTDDVNGTPPVMFGLFRRKLDFSISTCASWLVVGTTVRATFTVTNKVDAPFSGVTMTVNHPGGSISSAPFSIAANGTASVTFDIPSTTPIIPLTVDFTHASADPAHLTYLIAPLVSITTPFADSNFTCGATPVRNIYLRVTNVGTFAFSDLTIQASNTAGLGMRRLSGLSCVNLPIDLNGLSCGLFSDANFLIFRPVVAAEVGITFTLYEQGILFQTVNMSRTIPAI